MTGAFTIGSPNRAKETPLSRDTNLIGHWTFDEASGNALDYSGNGYTGTLNGPERVTTVGTNKAMYYDAGGADYISTPSFAIPNTGILTIEAWMKSVFTTDRQSIVGDNAQSGTIGYIGMYRYENSSHLHYQYANNTKPDVSGFTNFFQDLDNQGIHITIVCDYNNKTLKAYRNGVQFGATAILTGTPPFPLTDRTKYIGAGNATLHKLTDGSLDEVRIYNRGLSAEEVSSIYNATKSKYGF